MFASRRKFVIAAGAAFGAAAVAFPTIGYAAEVAVPQLAYELDRFAPTPDRPLPALSSASSDVIDGTDQRCMAKVVHHEARNQPHAGMIAVAQTLVNRLKAGGRFGGSICEVASQRGQFFDVQAYHPREDGDWQIAMDVAQEALSGRAEPVAPGALFFRSAFHPATSFFRSRQRVAAVGDQVFYR